MRVKLTKPELKWWELLDWSEMKFTFDNLTINMQRLILERGYWSKGKGVFNESIQA